MVAMVVALTKRAEKIHPRSSSTMSTAPTRYLPVVHLPTQTDLGFLSLPLPAAVRWVWIWLRIYSRKLVIGSSSNTVRSSLESKTSRWMEKEEWQERVQ